MSNATDKQWLDALGSRLEDALNCSDLDVDTTELIVASFSLFPLHLSKRTLTTFIPTSISAAMSV